MLKAKLGQGPCEASAWLLLLSLKRTGKTGVEDLHSELCNGKKYTDRAAMGRLLLDINDPRPLVHPGRERKRLVATHLLPAYNTTLLLCSRLLELWQQHGKTFLKAVATFLAVVRYKGMHQNS